MRPTSGIFILRPAYLFLKELHRLPRGTASTPNIAKYFSSGSLPTSISYRVFLLPSAPRHGPDMYSQLLRGHPGTSDLRPRSSRFVSSDPILQPPLQRPPRLLVSHRDCFQISINHDVSSTWGPKTGLRQMCQARYTFGLVLLLLIFTLRRRLTAGRQLLWRYHPQHIQFSLHDRVLYTQLYPWRTNVSKHNQWQSQLEVCCFIVRYSYIREVQTLYSVGIVIIAIISLLVRPDLALLVLSCGG